MKQDKVYGLIGLAAKGRNAVSGEFAVEAAIKDGSAYLVILAKDASDNTEKLFRNKCSFYGVPLYTYGTKDALGQCLGKDVRASVAIVEEGLAKALGKHLEALQN